MRFGGVVALDDLSFSVAENEICGLIGPNGAGKTTMFNVVSRIYEPNEGHVLFDGKELLSMPMEAMRKIRGNDMAMIFQEPLTSLNPVFTVGDQIAEQIRRHRKTSKKESWDRACADGVAAGSRSSVRHSEADRARPCNGGKTTFATARRTSVGPGAWGG